MIVKSMTRKTASFSQLLEYVNRSKTNRIKPILHNLRTKGDEVKEIEKEFRANASHCLKRVNGIVLYHEVLALAGEDRELATPEILLDLGRKYLELRASQALAFGAVHLEQSTPHLHFVISGNLIESSKKLRLSKREFDQVKRELERYQRERYPFLEHSVVFQEKERDRGRVQTTPTEQERARRIKEQGKRELSDKEKARERFLACLIATSQEEFESKLRENGIEMYVRGSTAGIQDSATRLKFRLRTLGVLEQYQKTKERWKTAYTRSCELVVMEKEMVWKQWREFEFKEQIFEVLNREKEADCPEEERERVRELARIARVKRERRRERGVER